MLKIVTKKDRVISQSKRMICCTRRVKGDHCLDQCPHGNPHEKDSERDACHLHTETCVIDGIYRVTCKPLSNQKRNEWIKKEIAK